MYVHSYIYDIGIYKSNTPIHIHIDMLAKELIMSQTGLYVDSYRDHFKENPMSFCLPLQTGHVFYRYIKTSKQILD